MKNKYTRNDMTIVRHVEFYNIPEVLMTIISIVKKIY